jgi:glycosyltransferase involved in cell wall biosynthesis
MVATAFGPRKRAGRDFVSKPVWIERRPGAAAPQKEPDRGSPELRTLVMTMLDLAQEPNQRTQHVVRMLAGISGDVLVVSKVKVLDRSPRALLRHALRCSIRSSRSGHVTTLTLHPPLNYAQALAAGLVQGAVVDPPRWPRRALASALSLLGIARDLLIAPSFLAAVLLETRAPFDLCVVEGPWTGVAAWLLRALGRVRLIVYDDIDHVAGGQMLRLRRVYAAALERAMIRRADLVISVGWMLQALRRRTTGRDVLVIPNGVDPWRFDASRPASPPPHAPALVYVGHLAHYCGVDLAIRALPRIRRALPQARLIVVGDGDPPYVDGLRQLAHAQGVADAVEWRGRLPYDALPAVLCGAHLGLCTFRLTPLGVHAFPLKVIEYMAAGLPVLCTKGTEAEQILRRHRAGRAVEFDPQALAEGAIELLGDVGAHAAARAAGLAAAEELTWERAMGSAREAILTLLQRTGRGLRVAPR